MHKEGFENDEEMFELDKEAFEEEFGGFSDDSRSTIDDLLGDDFPDEASISELLRVSDPPHVKGKGRPKGSSKASMASRKQQAFKNSTRRLPSAFKLQEARILDAE